MASSMLRSMINIYYHHGFMSSVLKQNVAKLYIFWSKYQSCTFGISIHSTIQRLWSGYKKKTWVTHTGSKIHMHIVGIRQCDAAALCEQNQYWRVGKKEKLKFLKMQIEINWEEKHENLPWLWIVMNKRCLCRGKIPLFLERWVYITSHDCLSYLLVSYIG